MNKDELKSCPFCGAKDGLVSLSTGFVECRDGCGATGPDKDNGDWNMRQLSDVERLTAEVLALREALQKGVDLIQGDAVGPEWKKGCAEFIRNARTAIKGDI